MSIHHKIPKIDGYTRKEVVAFFRIKLSIAKPWVVRGCAKIYEQQTYAEQKMHMSSGHNGLGFNKNHSLRMSGIARVIFSCLKIEDSIAKLQKADMEYLFKTMKYYAAQLASVSDPLVIKKLMDEYYNGCLPVRVRLRGPKVPGNLNK